MIRFNIVSASDLADPNGVSKFIHNFITNIDSSDVSLSRVYARYKKRVISVEPSEYKDLIDKVEDAGHNSRKEKIKVNNKIKSSLSILASCIAFSEAKYAKSDVVNSLFAYLLS